jgi:hypothetical protein
LLVCGTLVGGLLVGGIGSIDLNMNLLNPGNCPRERVGGGGGAPFFLGIQVFFGDSGFFWGFRVFLGIRETLRIGRAWTVASDGRSNIRFAVKVQGSRCRGQGAGVKVQGSRCRGQGAGVKVQGSMLADGSEDVHLMGAGVGGAVVFWVGLYFGLVCILGWFVFWVGFEN